MWLWILLAISQLIIISFWINDAKRLECADFFPVAPKGKGETLERSLDKKNIWLPASSDNLTIIEDYVPHRPLVVVADDVPGDKYADLIDFAAGFKNDNVKATALRPQSRARYSISIFLAQRG